MVVDTIILYSQKIWRGIKFGGLAVCIKTAKLKSAKLFYTCMYIWRYHTTKFKSTNGVINVLGQIAKFNDRQYFQLYIRYYSKSCSLSCVRQHTCTARCVHEHALLEVNTCSKQIEVHTHLHMYSTIHTMTLQKFPKGSDCPIYQSCDSCVLVSISGNGGGTTINNKPNIELLICSRISFVFIVAHSCIV